MSNTNTGGPAFPIDSKITPSREQEAAWCGMTLRDYFAAKALQGMLTSDMDYEEESRLRKDFKAYCDNIAESAYDYADAMIRARGGK